MSQTQTQNAEPAEQFEQFFREYYMDEIAILAQHYPNEQQSLWIEARDLNLFDADLLDSWINNPTTTKAKAEVGLTYVDLPVPVDLSEAHVRLTDSTGSYIRTKSVADLTSKDLGGYIGVNGVMEKITKIKPRLDVAAFECLRCGIITTVPQGRSSLQEPEECSGCQRNGPFHPNVDQSELHDSRKIKFKANPEDEEAVARGDSITVHVEHDLCEHGGENGLASRSGEEVTIFGTLELDEGAFDRRNESPDMDTWFDSVAMEFAGDDYADLQIEEHRDEFEHHAAQDDAVRRFADSIAPTLYREPEDQLDTVIVGAVAWLFGGYRLDPEGMGLKRGDIHMGNFGDPGLGKSTVHDDLADIAPKCVYRSGSRLSAAGLTAAAVQEEFDGKSEWTLQPGVLPRANGGHCIIDEVDAVVDEDTKDMHDALEGEQLLKVDKAGMTASLPTRTGVMVAGNPKEGRFDKYAPIPPQIGLDPALVSRMDLLFAMEDTLDRDVDEKKADHILDSFEELANAQFDDVDEGEVERSIDRKVPLEVLRAWIGYARENVFPRLTPEAKEVLKEFYLDVRNIDGGYDGNSDENTMPATARTLEAGVRLATAYARVNLSETIEPEHAEQAVEISRRVVSLNYDPESDRFDAGKNDTGRSQTQRDRVKTIEGIVEELQEEYSDKPGAPKEKVIERAAEAGIEDSKAKHEIEKMRDKGGLYSPDQNHYRKV